MTIPRGEIYFVNLNPVEGKDQAGRRPVLVLSSGPTMERVEDAIRYSLGL